MHTRPLSSSHHPKIPSKERPLAHGLHCPAQGKGYLFSGYQAGGPYRYILIGRKHTCDIWFDDRYLSGVHAMIKHRTDGTYTLRDCASENGVFVDGVRIAQPVILRVGMYIAMGRIELIATNERGSLPIEATTITGFARKAAELYGNCAEAGRHIGRSREFVRLRCQAGRG